MTRTGPAPRPRTLQQPRRWYAYTSGPMGNAWPIYRSGPNTGDPIPGWVSFHNTNASYPVQYYRAENEDVGLPLLNSYQGFNVTPADGVFYYSGSGTPPNGSISVCTNSPLYDQGYFRVGVLTELKETEMASVRFYPNPTGSQLNLDYKGNLENLLVKGIDGRDYVLNVNSQVNNTVIDLSQLPSGVYFITTTISGRTYHEKIIKN